MIPKLPPKPKPQTPEEYQKERHDNSMRVVSDRMENILHGEKVHERAVTDYDILGKK